MNRAGVMVLQRPPYYGHYMLAALKRLGYAAQEGPLKDPQPGDVLVTWNRHQTRDRPVQAHEAAGGTVIVVENGYLGRNFNGSEWFAMSLGQHNGAGTWPKGSAERWDSLKVPLKPWKRFGNEIVVLASRNMGSAKCREPSGWADSMVGRYHKATAMPVRIRKHPGPQYAVPEVSLEDDLANAWAAVTWGSSAGLKAICLGVPVFHGFPDWIGASAASRIGGQRFMGDRSPMLHRLATAMWSVDEVKSGKAFECLLRQPSTCSGATTARSV